MENEAWMLLLPLPPCLPPRTPEDASGVDLDVTGELDADEVGRSGGGGGGGGDGSGGEGGANGGQRDGPGFSASSAAADAMSAAIGAGSSLLELREPSVAGSPADLLSPRSGGSGRPERSRAARGELLGHVTAAALAAAMSAGAAPPRAAVGLQRSILSPPAAFLFSGGGGGGGGGGSGGEGEGRRISGSSGGFTSFDFLGAAGDGALIVGGAGSSSGGAGLRPVAQLELVVEQDSPSIDAAGGVQQKVVNRASITFDFDRQRADGNSMARELVAHLASLLSLRAADETLVPFLAALLETHRFAFRVSCSAAVEGTRLLLHPAFIVQPQPQQPPALPSTRTAAEF